MHPVFQSSCPVAYSKVKRYRSRPTLATALLTIAQKCFTISEVAADRHELMILQRSKRPSVARVNEQLDPRFAASRHTTAPISHTRTSPHSS